MIQLQTLSAATMRTLLLSLCIPAAVLSAGAQVSVTADTKPEDTKQADSKPNRPQPDTYEALYLTNSPQTNDLNDIQTGLRNMLPYAKVYGVPSQHAILLYATREDIATAKRLLADLDKKKSAYRLTYTLTESDGGKSLSSKRYSLIAVTGEKTELKQGNRIPLVTGSTDSDTSKTSTQVQYVDVGLNIDATLDAAPDSLRLRSRLEQSGVGEEKLGIRSGLSAQDPVIQQSTLNGTATLILGKSMLLGSLDVPGTTRQIDVEVIAELVK